MQSKAGKKSSIIGPLGNSSSPMQASLQGRQQRKLISGYLFCAIKYRFSANEGVLLVICVLQRYLFIQASEIVRGFRVLTSGGMKFVCGLARPIDQTSQKLEH